MLEINVGPHCYMVGRLDAFAQFHVSRRIAPVVPTLLPVMAEFSKTEVQAALASAQDAEGESVEISAFAGLGTAVMPFAEALAQMSDENADYVIKTCLSVVKRVTDSGLSAVSRQGNLMFDDMDLGAILPLVIAVLRSSLGNFIQGLLIKEIQQPPPA